jgi:hypothetical protein
MKLYKKINLYLIENYPLVWHSRILELTLISLILNVFAYLFGYSYTSLINLQDNDFESIYSNSGFVFIHLIFFIITLVIWAMFFFRNNAFKKFYPLNKFYFTKLFFLLFIPFFLLGFIQISFKKGVITKIENLVAYTEFNSDVKTINLGYPYLIQEEYLYNFKPENDLKNERISSFKYDFNTRKFIEQSNLYDKNGKIYDPNNHPENNIILDDSTVYQIYYYKNFKKCFTDERKILNKFIHSSELPLKNSSSLVYYNDVLFSNKEFENSDDERSSFVRQITNSKGDYIYNDIKENVSKKKRKQILKRLRDFQLVCDKYHIKQYFDAEVIENYLFLKNYENLNFNLIRNDDSYLNFNLKIKPNDPKLIEKLEESAITENQNLKVPYYFYDYKLDNLFSNIQQVNENKYNYYTEILIILITVVSLLFFIILLEFNNILSIIISLPVIGLLFLVNGLVMLITRSYDENSLLNIYLINEIILWVIFLINLKTNYFKKSLMNVFISILYLTTPFLFLTILANVANYGYDITKTNICKETITEYYKPYSYLDNPFVYLAVSIISILIFTTLLKKWQAYKE